MTKGDTMKEINGFDYTDVLLKASELVAEDGRWVQSAWFHTGKRAINRAEAQGLDAAGVRVGICVLGAVTLAAHRLDVSESVLKGARTRLAWFLRKFKGAETGVADWNDRPGRTAHDAAEALRAAAEMSA